MKAVICPVCNGKGQLENPESTSKTKDCHGCDGLGWVEVEEDISRLAPPDYPYYPIYPFPPYYPWYPAI